MKRFLYFSALALFTPPPLQAAPKVLPVLNSALPDQELDPNPANQSIDVPSLFGTEEIDDQVVRFTSQTTNGSAVMDFALFTNKTPITRANFLQYVTDGAYNQSFIHRSMPGFVIQGGGFFDSNPGGTLSVAPVLTDPAITNEFAVSNTYATISMAKTGGDPDSATSQWFVSLGDNSANLDTQNGGFTVFGRVTKSTMPSAAEFGNPTQYPIWNLSGGDPNNPFTSVPLISSFTGGQVAATDLILFPTVALAPLPAGEAGESTTLDYSFSNSNPSVVTTTLSPTNQLLVSYPTDATGSSTITVTATDSVGNAVDDQFTIQILQTYSNWKDQNFSEADANNPAISGPGEDPNNDGMSNLRLYVHGLSTTESHPEPVTFSTSSGFPVFSFPFVNYLKDVTIQIQRSTDLGQTDAWAVVPHTVISPPTTDLKEQRTIQGISALTGTSAFYRVVFNLSP